MLSSFVKRSYGLGLTPVSTMAARQHTNYGGLLLLHQRTNRSTSMMAPLRCMVARWWLAAVTSGARPVPAAGHTPPSLAWPALKALGVHRGSPRHASRWLTCGEPARPSRSTPSARPDGEESLLLALHTFATAAPSRNPLAQRLLAVLRPIRLTCGWGRWKLRAPPVLQCKLTLIVEAKIEARLACKLSLIHI